MRRKEQTPQNTFELEFNSENWMQEKGRTNISSYNNRERLPLKVREKENQRKTRNWLEEEIKTFDLGFDQESKCKRYQK